MRETPLILVVDDDPGIQDLVRDILTTSYRVVTASSVKEAQKYLGSEGGCDLVLTDMIMPQMGGMELVQYLRLHHPETLVIVFTGFASYQDAVDAVKLGAFDYLPKPLQPEILRHAIERALDYQRLLRSQRDLEVVLQGAESLGWQALELVSGTEARHPELRDILAAERPQRSGPAFPGRRPEILRRHQQFHFSL